MKKICIIKLGAIGDVLRTTPILRVFTLENNYITWITTQESSVILKGNKLINRLIIINTGLKINESFDELYNFDEDKLACWFAEKIKAKTKKGYGLKYNSYYPFDKDSMYAYKLSKDDKLKFRLNKKTYQQIIFEMAGLKWNGEDYILNYYPKNSIKHNIGVNYIVGTKYTTKLWPYWKEFAKMTNASVQKEFPDIKKYIEWINSCNTVVTLDSLGMHIALALKKRVIALFGPTSYKEIEMYGRGIKLYVNLNCSPCYKNKCNKNTECMRKISIEKVFSKIQK